MMNVTTIGAGLGRPTPSAILAWGLGTGDGVTTATPIESLKVQTYTLKSSSKSTWKVYSID